MQTDSKPWSFTEFIDATSQHLAPAKAKIVQRHEDGEGCSWWFTFNRAPSTYRISFDRRTTTLALEKGQGSFVPNSLPTWRVLESRSHPDPSFESILEVITEMLARFH